MIVSFFGHSSYSCMSLDKEKALAILQKEIGDSEVEFYLGNYGNFDNFAYDLAQEYKNKNSNAKLIFVTPYLNNKRHNDFAKKCDESVYPPIEKTPLRFAIVERNKWVVQKSDLIIFYYKIIGSTRDIYEYANSKNKRVINLAEQSF